MGIYKIPKIIEEVYFGKTKNILKIQTQFSKFRNQFINNNITFSTKINIDPELLNFNRMIEKEFGFKSFTLYVVNDIYDQAYTLPIGLTPGKSMDATNSGFKFKSENGYTTLVCISTGLLLNKKFSDEEVLAILLHEIGHSFSYNIDRRSTVFYVLQQIVYIAHLIEQVILFILAPMIFIKSLGEGILSIPILNQIFIGFSTHFKKKNKDAPKIFDFLLGVVNGIDVMITETGNLKVFFLFVFNSISMISILPLILVGQLKEMTPLKILSTYLGYNGEKVSDNFATIYGYGSELGSALTKMTFSSGGSITNGVIEKMPLISNFYKLMILPMEVILTGFDCHPNTPSRIDQQIKYLQKEVEKND